MKFRFQFKLLLLVAIGGVVSVPLLSSFLTPVSFATQVEHQPQPALTIETVKLENEEWPLKISASGSLAPWQEVVVAAETGGLRITEVYADVGTSVLRGQKLAQLAQDLVKVEFEKQQASVAHAKAELEEAKANAQRARNLKGRALSDQQISQYLIGQDKAQAKLDEAEAQLKSHKIRLNQTDIVAMDDGVVSSRLATLGAVVQVGTELFRLVRKNRIEWRAEIMADKVSKIKPGDKARIELANGDVVNGTVRLTAPTFDINTRKSLVYVDLPPENTSVRVGMFAIGDIFLGTTQVSTLPHSAIVLRDGYSYVFEIDNDQRVVQKKVVTGRRVGNRIEIVSNIGSETQIVASGGAFLNDGDTVRIVDSTTALVSQESE